MFIDEAKVELTSYTRSRKDKVTEVNAGNSGEVGLNLRRRARGLMVVGF